VSAENLDQVYMSRIIIRYLHKATVNIVRS